MFDDAPLMVEDDEALVALAERLRSATVIGVDTESDSMYHYKEKVCLVQITDAHGDIIVDPLTIDDMSPLEPIFADPSVVKIFHGADYDIVSLKRDFGYQTNNLFDTLVAAQFLGLQGLGLADLIGRFFGIPIDKKFQRHDWSRRPLHPEHLDYARGDTHWLLALREILLRRLEKMGRVAYLEEECALLSKREWAGRAFDPDGWVRIKRSSTLDDDGKRVLRKLYLYRDAQARSLDRPPYKVIGDRVLMEIATKRPRTGKALDQVVPKMRALKRRHATELLRAVRDGLEDDTPLPSATPSSRKPVDDDEPNVRLRGRAAERVFNALKDWRNQVVGNSEAHTPYTVASNATLKSIARHLPSDLEELGDVPDVRRWQVVEHGEAILDLLAGVAPVKSAVAKKRRKRRSSKKSAS
jgi:ribonuclease D